LISSTAPERSLTIFNAAAAEHSLVVGLYWIIPGLALALGYSALVYLHFAHSAQSANS
jgi:cytochrome bd-type quinol oxidase subunit 2